MGSATCGRPRRRSIAKVTTLQPGASQPEGETPQRLRVAFLTPGLGRGGAERWVVSLARWLQPEIDVVGIVSSCVNGSRESLHDEAARWAQVTSIASERHSSFRILQSADIVIAWGFSAMDAYLPKDLSAKVVYVAHGSGSWTADHVRWAEPRVDHWVAVSAACREAFPERLRCDVTVIHNGADIERTTPVKGREATRLSWGVNPGQIAVTYLGRFSPEKRPGAIADAIMHLPQQYVGIMAGSGWRESETREYCQRVAGDRVKFVGFSLHVGDALAASDVWLNASPSEGFSLSLIEAWLAGVPCVSTPTGAIPELQERHGKLVMEVPIGADGQQISNVIRRATDDGDGREIAEVTNRARLLAWSEFTGPVMGARWVDYLQMVAKGGTIAEKEIAK